jgi:threonine/homoserine/homoserine lactone efflux protein
MLKTDFYWVFVNSSQINPHWFAANCYFCEKSKTVFELVLKAIVTGLVLSIMLGPAFFVLLETSIRKGIKSALAFDAGVLLSDIIYIIIAYVFLKEVSQLASGDNNLIVKAVGGVLFLIFGGVTYFKRVSETKIDAMGSKGLNSKDYWMLFVKGLVLNIANPLVIFYWFSVMALAKTGDIDPFEWWHMTMYIGVILLTFFSIDILKIIGAKRLRPFITTSVLRSLNRVTGTVLFVFGMFLIIHSVIIWIQTH